MNGCIKQTHILFEKYLQISSKSQAHHDRGSEQGIPDNQITLDTKHRYIISEDQVINICGGQC